MIQDPKNCIGFGALVSGWGDTDLLLRLVNNNELQSYLLVSSGKNFIEIKPLEESFFYKKGDTLYHDKDDNFLHKKIMAEGDFVFSWKKKYVAGVDEIFFIFDEVLMIEKEKSFLFEKINGGNTYKEQIAQLENKLKIEKNRREELETLMGEVAPRRKYSYLKIIKRFCDCQSMEEHAEAKKILSRATGSHAMNKFYDMHESTLRDIWAEIQKLS